MSPYCYAANSPIVFIDEDGGGPRYAAAADAFVAFLKETYGLTDKDIIKTVSDDDISVQVTMTVRGVTMTNTFLFSKNNDPDDRNAKKTLQSFGMSPDDAMMAVTSPTSAAHWRAKERSMKLDKLEGGGVIALETVAAIFTFGSASALSGAAWLSADGAMVMIDIGFLLNNSTSVFYSSNKTFLSDIGIPQDKLDLIENTKDVYDFFTSMQDLIAAAAKDPSKFDQKTLDKIELMMQEITLTLQLYNAMKSDGTDEMKKQDNAAKAMKKSGSVETQQDF